MPAGGLEAVQGPLPVSGDRVSHRCLADEGRNDGDGGWHPATGKLDYSCRRSSESFGGSESKGSANWSVATWGRSPTCQGADGAELGRSGTCPTIIKRADRSTSQSAAHAEIFPR